MHTFSGYHIIDPLYESINSLVYRARRLYDDVPVVLKILREEYPSPERIAWLKREFELTRSLNLESVVQAYSLENEQHRWAIVLEDFGGESLTRHNLAGTLAPGDFLDLAIKITTIVGQIHQHQVIHKDINPSNVVLNSASQQIKLIDFGISTVFSREKPAFSSLGVLEGTLSYLSPEQTGRMNRMLDYRADFYSLGVTLYELLTGRLPFESDAPLELVHSHIARQPPPPYEIVPTVPPALSAIILKLMAKNAEDRYQSSHGIISDLEHVGLWIEHSTNGENTPQHPVPTAPAHASEAFVPGQNDIPDIFSIPQTLYGREWEQHILLKAFEQSCNDTTSLVLVTGPAGIGKTTLVHEIYKPITQRGGYFISGKFDQFQRDIPYAALIQAFRSLVRQLLAEGTPVATWRAKFLEAFGQNGQVLIEIVPEIALIIGNQPPVPDVPPTEAQNRLSLLFHRFIQVLARPKHPLVIFLDDMQWADTASLKLFEHFLLFPSNNHHSTALLLIGAYRDEEVGAGHPLRAMLTTLHQHAHPPDTIYLKPLTNASVAHLVSDTLLCSQEEASSLAQLLISKTGGNPFFINELLTSLYVEGLVIFAYETRTWKWDIDQIQAHNVTDNVVELMTHKAQQLNGKTQMVLKLAACIGNQFDLEKLAVVSQQSFSTAAQGLEPAISSGLIVPMDRTCKVVQLDVPGLADTITATYSFTHDRIQQAVYALIPSHERQEFHWRIGNLLLQDTSPEERGDILFDIVYQLNQGRTFLTSQEECIQLATLNLEAGNKAITSAAYESAYAYFHTGLEVLLSTPLSTFDECWQNSYELMLDLHVGAAEAAYLSGRFDEMEHLVRTVLSQARSLLDKVRVYEVKIQALRAQGQLVESVKLGVQVVGMLGVDLPEEPTPLDFLAGIRECRVALAGRQPIDLIKRPPLTDPTSQAIVRILTGVAASAYIAMPRLVPLILAKQIHIYTTHGNTTETAFTYVGYGMLLCGAVGDIASGYQFGTLGTRLLEHMEPMEASKIRAKILHTYNLHVRHWKDHLRETLADFSRGYQAGLESGDLEFASFAAYSHSHISYLVGRELPEAEQDIRAYGEAIAQINQKGVLNWNNLFHQVVLNLMTPNEQPWVVQGEIYNETEMWPYHQATNDGVALFLLPFNKLVLAYMFHAYDLAHGYASSAEAWRNYVPGFASVPAFHFYDSLARLAVVETTDNERQMHENHSTTRTTPAATHLERVADNQEKLARWARYAPMNNLHKYHLVEAERARLNGDIQQAETYYDQAIEGAHQQGFLQEEALAAERAGLFYLSRARSRIARTYLSDAHYLYLRWGAHAKVRDMEMRHPHILLGATQNQDHREAITNSRQEHHTRANLDITSVLKASQAIAGELVLENLLEKLLRIILENAGGERGVLILRQMNQWVIEAEGSIMHPSVKVLQSVPAEESERVPLTIINYVAHTRESVVLHDATQEHSFSHDRYIKHTQPCSILCIPLIHRGTLIGMLYLENNMAAGVFTRDRLEVLNMLSGQVVTSLEHARLYSHLEELVQERTLELSQTNMALESEIQERRRAEELLRQTRDELEERVQQRTAELTQANAALEAEVQERKLAERIQRHQAVHDALTNLPNRALFIELLGHAIRSSRRREGRSFAVIFLDLDNFKVVNDSLGHLEGDQLLITTAGRLKACLRSSDTVARLGGDEFIILLEDIDDISDAINLTNRVQEEVAMPLYINDHEVITTASIGIVMGSKDYVNPTDVLRDADTAMYRAKSLGPGRYAIFDTAMHASMLQRLHVETALRRGIENNELRLAYQPIVSLETGAIVGFEALVRWEHPQRGLIYPDEFIPTAEETGLITALDWWVLAESCRQMQTWRANFPHIRPLSININLSSRAFMGFGLVERIRQTLQETGLDVSGLKLEITENVMMDHSDTTINTLRLLRDMGIHLCIDDFGTGYSSLRYLHRFPVQTVKIDKSFIFSLHQNTESTMITQSIVTLSHMLGKDVVAEGVETLEHLAYLRDLGCEYGQGFFFSRGRSAEEIERLLELERFVVYPDDETPTIQKEL
jgi:diguanylate cyclase (GGDEF)-like protein